MDPLCHTLVGAALAASGLGRRTPLAAAALVIGANAPDVDGLIYFLGSRDAGLLHRRGLTHGVPALLLWPLVITGLLLAFDRLRRRLRRRPDGASDAPRPAPRLLLALSAIAVVTHPTLDWLNNYGMRWWMPFDASWSYGDTLFIIDPFLWLMLGGALFLGYSSTWRSILRWLALAAPATLLVLGSARGAAPALSRALWVAGLVTLVLLRLCCPLPRAGWDRRRAAAVALAAGTLYVLALFATGRAARSIVASTLTHQGITDVRSLMVAPRAANPLSWEVVLATPEAYRYGTFDWRRERRLELVPDAIPRPRPDPVVDAALAAPSVRGLVNWARFPWVEVEPDAGGYTVHVRDARYVRSRGRGFGGAAVRLDRELRPVER